MGDSEEKGPIKVSLEGVVAIVASIAALLASVYAARVARRAHTLASESMRVAAKAAKSVSRLESILGKALQAIDEVDEAALLKRRRRRRYVAALILSDSELPRDPRLVQKSLEDAVRRLAGEVGLADARPQLVYYDSMRGAMIVRTNHLAVNTVLASLVLINEIGGVRARVVPLRTAGTLRAAKRYLGILEKLPSRVG